MHPTDRLPTDPVANAECVPAAPFCNPEPPRSAGFQRREFLKTIGFAAAAAVSPRQAMAGPFSRADFDKLVPADKKLHADWVKSLFERGTPQVYRGEELKWIGQPVGGLCAGQLYLGGDGKLWHWDIFNQSAGTGDGHYANPPKPASSLKQEFSLGIGGKTRVLDATGFSDIRYRGEYPIGRVEYRAADVEITLEAFSPFIPLNTDDSSLPATVMQFKVKNTGTAAVEATLAGSLENVIARAATGVRRNRVVAGDGFSFLECAVEEPATATTPAQPDVVFEDWNKETYVGWTVEGTAFGTGPIKKSAIPDYQGDVGGDTERVVNSHASAPGTDIGTKDNATGKLTSRPFKIGHRFVSFWVGGGNHANNTCVNLVVDGKAVRTVAGKGDNRMGRHSFDVQNLRGREATLEIVDAQAGSWGNIGVGRITFTDQATAAGKLEELPDFGTMGLALLGMPAEVAETAEPVGLLGRQLTLAPGESKQVTFVLAWHFPNLTMDRLPGGRFYATKFESALAVAKYVAANFERLATQTRLWRDTWYDSTLPYWFLDRTMLNTSILATSTSYRFKNGRFYGWEGVGCCAGTCGHVWHYAHAPARLFPELERDLRERVDFGLALQPDGAIWFRAEHNNYAAIDAQAGSVLRAYREHQMSADSEFLKRIWPGVKRATDWLIAKDADNDGIIEGNQHNTLDADWFGPVAWLSGLYLAALNAAEAMALELGDTQFAKRCRAIHQPGMKKLVADLFDDEYFINKPDPKHGEAINSGTGCEIDQVMGQSWAWQVGMPRVFPAKETKSALQALWKYNFTPDVGPYRAANKPGRWYAMAGEAGLLMCTFPRTDWDFAKAGGTGHSGFVGYFNECMNGFEYQAAGHMIWEGMVMEGLAITRAVHDRYHASRRNPWNEVECGDHYARSMASYGVFLAACGFAYHGPDARIGFAPRLTPEDFKAPFTTAEGWGTFTQRIREKQMNARLQLRWGQLRLRSLSLELPENSRIGALAVTLNGSKVAAVPSLAGRQLVIRLESDIRLKPGDELEAMIA